LIRLFRLAVALFVHRDVHYVRRLLKRAGANLRLVTGALGADYLRILPYRDFGGVDPAESCERYVAGVQPAGFVRVNLIPYHLALPDVAGRIVVEAGCNEGAGSALLATRAHAVHAFDRSPEAIAAARARHVLPNLHFVVHDATRPFPGEDGSADVVFASEVIEHLADGRAFLAAAARALRPGGLLILKTPNDAWNRYENRLNPHHVNPYDERRLRRELAREFEPVAISDLTFETSIQTAPEDHPDALAPEATPYVFGEPVVIDRVLVTRMRVTPRFEPPGTPGEYLFARAVRRSGSA
jgi:SAM-dependent methyltransferase